MSALARFETGLNSHYNPACILWWTLSFQCMLHGVDTSVPSSPHASVMLLQSPAHTRTQKAAIQIWGETSGRIKSTPYSDTGSCPNCSSSAPITETLPTIHHALVSVWWVTHCVLHSVGTCWHDDGWEEAEVQLSEHTPSGALDILFVGESPKKHIGKWVFRSTDPR